MGGSCAGSEASSLLRCLMLSFCCLSVSFCCVKELNGGSCAASEANVAQTTMLNERIQFGSCATSEASASPGFFKCFVDL